MICGFLIVLSVNSSTNKKLWSYLRLLPSISVLIMFYARRKSIEGRGSGERARRSACEDVGLG